MNINIKGINKAEVLAALYNNSRVQGMGALQARDGLMSKEDAETMIEKSGLHFDYLHGKIMKVDLKGDDFDPWLYDRDNGDGAASRALEPLTS